MQEMLSSSIKVEKANYLFFEDMKYHFYYFKELLN